MSLFKALFNRLSKLKEIHPNRNIITYLICVLIASILWFLNALNKEYSAEISYPVKYVNFPSGKYPVVSLPPQIHLEVKAKGFALLGHRIRTSFLPITFNVGTYASHFEEKNGMLDFTLNTNEIKDKISSQLSTEIKLQSVFPEKIEFKFARSVSKKVAIQPSVEYTLKRQYILNRIIATPDSILIQGPAPVIDTIYSVPTETVTLKNISKNTTRSTELQAIPGCQFEDINVKVEMQVEQFTEARKTIPITPLHVPESLILRLFPDHVQISDEIGLSQYDKITADDFEFAVEYPRNSQTTYLEVQVKKAPSNVKNLTFSPQKVEYILEKK